MKFEVYESSDGWRWRLVAGNGERVAYGEAYKTKYNVMRAIQKIQSDLRYAIAPVNVLPYTVDANEVEASHGY